MNELQKQRLKELKTKYAWKYVIYPGIIKMADCMPFNMSALKNSAKMLVQKVVDN